ncbi:MAG TPA: 2-dehydropantoate 2-reductase [Burkholderiales bacterium]|jgi:2-dehydropantoate 2-reductase|nr:2-dehydropantoate 2-reductase [Burkholderiales bacterium]
MKIAAIGAGGVGGYFGARLQQAGHDVAFIARGRHLAAIRKNGLTVESPLGNAKLAVKVYERPEEIGPVDVVMFAVKLWDTSAAAESIRPLLAGGGVVIPFQNGVESVDALRKVFGERPVMGGSAYIASRISAPGVIEHIGQMCRLQFGPLLPDQQPAAEKFLAACKQAGINAEMAEDVIRAIWEKFVFLVAVSSATAASRAPLGVVRADPDLRGLFEQAMRETWTVGRARGVKLADDFIPTRMKALDSLPYEMKASMAHDLEAGGKLEAPWLCGAVARMARELGLEAPVNATVYAALKPYLDGSARPAA